MKHHHDVLVVGAGIGGLTLALQLHQAGIECRLVEAAPALAPLGVGINILPHAVREFHRLGLRAALDQAAVRTRESVFYNRFGQLVHAEPAGTAAGYTWPQYSIHRGDLQMVLVDAVRERLGDKALRLGATVTRFSQDTSGVEVTLTDGETVRGGALVGCDGVHSAVRRQLFPDEGPPRYSGYTMWRGTTLAPPFLSGASMVRAGWLTTGKMVIYPIRDDVDGSGLQLVNWVAELETPQRGGRDWSWDGAVDDVIGSFADWHFDWLDVPTLIRGAERILEYPMVDQDPLPRWSFGRVTLLGDAAHPMVPRGSNGAGQAILDTRSLTDRLVAEADPVVALADYDAERREATSAVVRLNRTNPPDAILREVYERTGDKPFDRIEDVLTPAEVEAVLGRYRSVAGYSQEALNSPR
ncbi:flavin-dependent oxidoreductase [Streptomyces malaysiensis]|uniref:flavin-dependent oxidoreductase n=1 Tax=Streptomyces malaysiensis TaxID=92644 RepID=UPI002B2FE363|nr:flavin-dependent oxidoreductase [Streptomyces malaysiensis]